MVRAALLTALLAPATPAGSQEPPPSPPQAEATASSLPAIVIPPRRHPERASAEQVKAVDIPQAAKDEGHNGTATYTATIGADGKLVALVLKESSMSPAIDEAVKARAQALHYFPATDKDGNKIEGTTDVSMHYARYADGGISSYACGNLVREWDWFTAANAGRRKLFWPYNAYTSLASIISMEQGMQPDLATMRADRAKREKMWAALIKRCRKKPERLMLEEVDEPEAYRRLVDSF